MDDMDRAEIARACADEASDVLADPPSRGFVLDEVRADGDEVEVRFRWHRDPSAFVVRFPAHEGMGCLAEETPEDPDWPSAWAGDLRLWLMEELDTGFMSRARRSRLGERILLEPPDPESLAPAPRTVDVSEVPQYGPRITLPWRVRLRLLARTCAARLRGHDPAPFGWVASWGGSEEPEPGDGRHDGRHLAHAGLDISLPLALRERGELTAWVQAFHASEWGGVVGHAVLGPVVDEQVHVVALEVTHDGPESTADELVRLCVRLGADAGAARVVVPGSPARPERVIGTALPPE